MLCLFQCIFQYNLCHCTHRSRTQHSRPPCSPAIGSNLELFILSDSFVGVPFFVRRSILKWPGVEVERELPARLNTRINIHPAGGRSVKKALHYWTTDECTCNATFASHFVTESWEIQTWRRPVRAVRISDSFVSVHTRPAFFSPR